MKLIDMIALIDYGMGNLGSVEKALQCVGCSTAITSSPQQIEEASGIVLPGVGAFDDCMQGLRDRGLLNPLRELIAGGKPYLGICLGLQMLFEHSEEGQELGLGIFPGQVVRFDHNLNIPQIGWNQVWPNQPVPHLAGISLGSWFYFVHSYYVKPADQSIVATTTEYGYEFCSAVHQDNVFACQFHPEKSQGAGLKLLENFKQLTQVTPPSKIDEQE